MAFARTTAIVRASGLQLEPLVASHADEMFAVLSDGRMYDFMPGAPPTSLAALRERYSMLATQRSPDARQGWLNWIVRLDSGACAGFVQATLYTEHTGDFAFALAPALWGRGMALEACRAALPVLASEFTMHALFATADARNARSIRLLERLGFREIAPASYPHGTTEPGDAVFRVCLQS